MTFTRVLTASLLISFGLSHAADISVASNSGNVPFEFEDKNGKTVGFEVDLINLVAAKLNKSVEFTSMPFNALFSAVQSGRPTPRSARSPSPRIGSNRSRSHSRSTTPISASRS